jgi:hypothetical protein
MGGSCGVERCRFEIGSLLITLSTDFLSSTLN